LGIKRFAILLVQYGLLAVALLVTAGLSALTTMRVVLRTQEVVVPSLLNRRLPEAGPLAARNRLLLKVEGRRYDPKVPADRIVDQEPKPGSTLKQQRSVRVWVSLGPRRLTVPDVQGESIRSARLSLEQAQVAVGRVMEVNDVSEEGTILLQDPPPGETETLAEEGVTLLMSVGPLTHEYLMPDLIGKPAAEALDLLRAAGLKVAEVRYRTYPGVAPGVVLRQSPPSGYRVNNHSSVSLEVSQVTQ
jgi:serine/threonine-protein kinase